jgi:putative FmdB family regulatory protein
MGNDNATQEGGVAAMPIYEFKCNQCEYVFDELVPMNTQGDRVKCPKCSHVGTSKSRGSFLSATHGLENGHIAVGQKLTGKGGSASGPADSAPKPAAHT